jgi:5-methyltetrahydropteroyltriglutamate--homocysteine methyltransferase
MQISTTTTGIFPKISSSKEVPSLRANLHKFDREEISAEDLESIIQANIKRAIEDQVEAGIEIPTDGLIRWTDLFSPFVQAWDGITRRGIHRFYNTNTLYGEPVVEGELKFNPSQTLEDFKYAKTINDNIKATLPGVFTFANACVDDFYKDSKKLREVIAANLLEEAKALIEAGAKIIEVHEIELAWGDYDTTEVSEIYQKFGELDAKVIVISYFQNFDTETIKALVAAKCGVGIDVQKPHSHDFDKAGMILQAGIVDSRETKIESEEFLTEYKAKIESTFSDAAEIIYSTSSHVEYLPHAIAMKKIGLLKNLKS